MKLFVLTLFVACFATTFGEKQQKFEGYIFVYFAGENNVEGENIYIAASHGNDALNFTDLNGGKPILYSKYGTKGLRDPFIIRSQEGDKFYLLATDLFFANLGDWREASYHGSKYIEIWESTDLINWTEQRHTLVSPPNAGCAWAPEAHFDKNLGKYHVYWATPLFDEDDANHTKTQHQRMLYATTEDFVTFSEPQVWQDTGSDRIDTNILEVDGTLHRFTVAHYDGCHDPVSDSSTNFTAPVQDWHLDLTCLSKKVGTGYIEGPTSFKSNPGDVNGDKYYLFVDEAQGRGYVPLQTDDIANPAWKIPASYKMPTRARHGTVLPVTAEELAKITSALV